MNTWQRVLDWVHGIDGTIKLLLYVSVIVTTGVGIVGIAWELIRQDPFRVVIIVLAVALLVNCITMFRLSRHLKDTHSVSALDESLDEGMTARERRLSVGRDRYKDLSEMQQKDLDEAEQAYQEISDQLAAEASRHDSLRELCVSLWLEFCATAVPADMAAAFKLKVSVEFTDPRSEILAKRVSDLFVGRSWKTRDIEFKWRENPNADCDIIIYSDHSNAGGVRGAFRHCKLLDDKTIGRMPREAAMEDDVTIVVFGPRGTPSHL